MKQKTSAAANYTNPNVTLTRVAATVGLGAAMFTEGFIGFFEGIGDAVLNVGSGVTGLLGFKDASQQLKSMADYELSKNFVEENDFFRQLNKDSYFDKDSGYAKVCKGLGEVAAAAVTTNCVSSLWAGHLQKVGKVANLAENATAAEQSAQALTQAKKQVDRVKTGVDIFQKEVENVSSHVKKGESIPTALVAGTTETAGEQLVKNVVVKPASKALIEKTPVGQAADQFFRNNGEAIESGSHSAVRSIVSETSRAAAGEAATETFDAVADINDFDNNPYLSAGWDFTKNFTGKVVETVGAKKN